MLLELLGIESSQESPLKKWRDIVPKDDCNTWLEYFTTHVLRDRNPFDIECRLIRKNDKSEFWAYVYGNVEYDEQGHPARMLGIVQDIDHRKRAELEQQRLYEELRIQQSEKESLIYAMSHDMRAPLVNLLGFSNELEMEMNAFLVAPDEFARAESSSNMKECLRFITSSVHRMDRLQDGVLRYARLGRTELNLQEVSINDVVTNSLLPITHQIKTNNVTIHNHITHTCLADSACMDQVIANLLDNAIKYARPGVSPEITFSSREENKQIIYSIHDNGIGIPPSMRTRVFEIFQRLDSKTTSGEGLGLTLVRAILNRMNGNISIVDNAYPGTEFEIRLPKYGSHGENSDDPTAVALLEA